MNTFFYSILLLFSFQSMMKETDQQGHLPAQICIELHFNTNFHPVFYFKSHFRWPKSFRKKSGGLYVNSLFNGTRRQHKTACTKMISSYIRNVLDIAKVHISLVLFGVLWHTQPSHQEFLWHPFCRMVFCPGLQLKIGIIFHIYYCYRWTLGFIAIASPTY